MRIDWDGEQTRDYVYVEGRRASATPRRSTRGSGGCYVIGTGIKTSVNGIYRALVQISGFEAPMTAGPKRPGDPRDAQFDSAGAKEALTWQPVTKLVDGMLETYEFFKAAPR